MAQYIDADKLLESLQEELDYYPLLYTREQNEWFDKGLKRALRIVKTFPTADVVPKSEVDNLKVLLEMNEKAYEALRELYHTDTDALIEARRKTESEVAWEIFADIDRAVEKYSMGDIEYPAFVDIIAELKNKYTEEQE